MSTIGGIVPALITPFGDDEELDLEAFARLIDHVLGAGVHGLFVAGSQGEFWSLNAAEHRDVVRAAVDTAAGRVPVYAGVSAVTTRVARDLARQAEMAGADAVTMLAPYLINPSPRELRRHIETVAAAVDIPLIFYHHPARTGVRPEVAFLTDLARRDVIAGIKDSTGDLAHTLVLVDELSEQTAVMVGNDALVAPALLGGCSGAVASTANVAPSLHVAIYDAVHRGDATVAMNLQRRLSRLRDTFALGTFPTVMRDAMRVVGIPVGACRAPILPLDDGAQDRLRNCLQEIGVLPVGIGS